MTALGIFLREISGSRNLLRSRIPLLTCSTSNSLLVSVKNLSHAQFKQNVSTEKKEVEKLKVKRDEVLYNTPHFKRLDGETEVLPACAKEYSFDCPVWDLHDVTHIKETHIKPSKVIDYLALGVVSFLRRSFDLVTRYHEHNSESHWIRRIVFLETVAGVPGMVGAMVRHLKSLRKMEKDHGWIHTLLQEAENERMHLMIALLIHRRPSTLVRLTVIGSQFFFLLWYTVCYIFSPRFCHRFVGYLEEEAVRTYNHLIEEIDKGELPGFSRSAPQTAIEYYGLPEKASVRDVFLAMRRDESHHRDVNHLFAEMKASDPNPFT